MSTAEKRPAEDNEEVSKTENGDAKKAKADDEVFGHVMFAGASDWDAIGRKSSQVLPRSDNTKWKPVRLAGLKNVNVKSVHSGPFACHTIAVSKDGQCYGWGRNEKGQLGLGNSKDRYCPKLIDGLTGHKIVSAAIGRNHTMFLTDEGAIYACGDNKSGQCGTGAKDKEVNTPKRVLYEGPPAKKIACGAEFSAMVDVQGGLWTWGHPENGQLGQNSDGGFLEKAGKVSFHFVHSPEKVTSFVEKDPKTKKATPVRGVYFKDVDCGISHGVAITEGNSAYSWGFGGYGRLGHSGTDNELVPRLIKFLDGPKRGITRIYCGAQFNLASAELPGTTYMWGQYASSKEANMYPKPVQDLSGWMDVKALACNSKGWVISVDGCTLAAMPSPCYGELGMGPNMKSSAQPTQVKTMNDVDVVSLAAGVSHTVYVAQTKNEAEKEKLYAKFEEFDQTAMDAK